MAALIIILAVFLVGINIYVLVNLYLRVKMLEANQNTLNRKIELLKIPGNETDLLVGSLTGDINVLK